jgi:Tol biopolymer transport system component
MAYSPAGRHIAYDLGLADPGLKHDIFLLSLDGTSETALVTHPALDYVVAWAPDGKYLFFASDRTGDWSLWRLPVADGKAGGPAELVKRHTGRLEGMGFTTNGSLYYRIRGRNTDVYEAELDAVTAKLTGAPRLVAERFMGSNANPVWSPDGKYLAYYSRRSTVPATPALCIRDEETGQERELHPKLGWYQGLSWFPEGRSLLAYGVDLTGTMAYFRIDAATGDVSKLLDIDFRGLVPYAVLSPDGKRLYNLGPGGLKEHDLLSGRERTIPRAPEGAGFVELAMSPDGKLLATKLNWRGKKPYYSLAVLPVDTGEIREVTTAPPLHWFQNIVWTPDGRYLLFTKHYAEGGGESEKVELWRVAVDSGKEENLDTSLQGTWDLSIHPDGRRIAFTRMQNVTQIWVMENFVPSR